MRTLESLWKQVTQFRPDFNSGPPVHMSRGAYRGLVTGLTLSFMINGFMLGRSHSSQKKMPGTDISIKGQPASLSQLPAGAYICSNNKASNGQTYFDCQPLLTIVPKGKNPSAPLPKAPKLKGLSPNPAI
jgi:hypothetical protein